MKKPSVSQYIVSALAQAGVQRVYGIVGDSLNGVTEAVRRHPDVDWVSVRHEETAAFAAGAEAQLTGRLAVCAGSSGPGCIHLVNGLYDAQRSLAPVLALAAHIPSTEIGTGFFQESHPDRLFVDCSHYSELISSPRQMPRTLQIAMQTAITRRGVAVVVLPGDVALAEMTDMDLAHPIAGDCSRSQPCDDTLAELADLLTGKARVTILAGAGCAGAHGQLLEVAATLKAPIVHTLRGKEHVAYDNPYDVGMTGLIGLRPGYKALERCDVLLMLGTDFPYTEWYPKGKTIIQVDIDGQRLGRRCGLTLGVQADVRETLTALLPLLVKKEDSGHLDQAVKQHVSARKRLDEHVRKSTKDKPINPEYLTTIVSELASSDAVFTADVGMCTVWAARYLEMTRERRLLGSFTHGSMANALPQAIGAQLCYPDRQVISLSGDGGFTMLLGDFITLVQAGLPVKVVVYNNSSLAMVKLEQNVAGLPDFGTQLENPNFAKVAEAMGARGIRVEDPGEVRSAVASALETDGPVLVDVLTNPGELSMPPKTTLKQVQGYSLYLIKEILGGRAGGAIESLRSSRR